MNFSEPDSELDRILERYSQSFKSKLFLSESPDLDDLMQVFALSQTDKAQNRQYWGRELGMCWQRLIIELCKQTSYDFEPRIKDGSGELCDLVVGKDAIDTKYRIGSGDSGTLKKFKQYGAKLLQLEYRPVMLILRKDNLPAAITALKTGGWTVITGEDSYDYIEAKTSFDLRTWLRMRKGRFSVKPETEINE